MKNSISLHDLEAQCIASTNQNVTTPLQYNKIKRYSNDNNQKKRDEWYIAFNGISSRSNSYLIFIYGSWTTGDKDVFRSWDNQLFNLEEHKEFAKELKRAQKEQEKQLKEIQEKSEKDAVEIHTTADNEPKSDDHDKYLRIKGVKPYGDIKFGKNPSNFPSIIIPLRDIEDRIRTLQFISVGADGKIYKMFLSGGEKKGNFFIIGTPVDGDAIYIVEGYATGASVYEATNKPTVIAFDAGNLLSVIENIKKKFPNNIIIIAGDNDWENHPNTGKEKAEVAAKKFGCKLVFPEFLENKNRDVEGKAYTDFNDLHQAYGIEEVKKQLCEQDKGIYWDPGLLHEILDAAEQVIVDNPGVFYQRAGKIVQQSIMKSTEDKKSPDTHSIAETSPFFITEMLTRWCPWYKHSKGTLRAINCPPQVAQHLMARKSWKLPPIEGIINTPTLRRDGSILEKPGYDEKTGLLFITDTQFEPINSKPSKKDADEAVMRIIELFSEVLFEGHEKGQEDPEYKMNMSVAISAMITAVIRYNLRIAPAHGFSSPDKGCGKSTLAEMISCVAFGRKFEPITYTGNDDEERKRIISLLNTATPIIWYDNVTKPIDNPILAASITQESIQERELSKNNMLPRSTNTNFLFTGVNLVFKGDMAVRALLCRVNPLQERPSERKYSKDPIALINLNRPQLVKDLLTIPLAYKAAESPYQKITPWRFKEYDQMIRYPLVWLGLEDPYKSSKNIISEDPESITLSNFLAILYETFKSDLFLVSKIVDDPTLQHIIVEIIGDKHKSNTSKMLGDYIRSNKGTIKNGLRIEKGEKKLHNTAQWRIVKS